MTFCLWCGHVEFVSTIICSAARPTATFDYDLARRLSNRQYRTAANSPSGRIADSDQFTYDKAGRMLTAYSGRYNNTVGYSHDAAGLVVFEVWLS